MKFEEMMKLKIIIVLLLNANFFAIGQKKTESLAIIENMIGFNSLSQKIAYTERLEPFYLTIFKRAFTSTTIVGINSTLNQQIFEISQEELSLIKSKLNEFEKPYWKKGLFPNSVLIPIDTLDTVLKDKRRGWKYFHNNYGDLFCQFTDPIFLRGGTICIVQIYFLSDERKGRHELSILKKVDGRWTRFLTIFGGKW